MLRRVFRPTQALAALAVAGSLLVPRAASAEVTLVDKDGWKVFITGRVQAFLNYNKGDGHPEPGVVDGNGASVVLRGGGQLPADAYHEYPAARTDANGVPLEPTAADRVGKIEEMRLRTGFVGNVLGFGIRKQINDTTDVLAYTAVTTYIDSTTRRKYLEVRPDWRESFLKITAPWGSVTAGRFLTLFSRGATEITYLYGFKYGLGWPGSVSSISGSGPGAGHVGFGVLGNGFGGGIAYATPLLAGAQINVALFDANSLVGSGQWERVKYPRAETEITFEKKLGGTGMFKLFANGAWQKVYNKETPANGTILGAGYGGRLEVGPVHLGLAGHYGRGVGLDFALQPSEAIWDSRMPDLKMRTFSGYYAQLMVSALKSLDLSAGAGMTAVKQNAEDKVDLTDDDGTPATPSCCDKNLDPANPTPKIDSVGFVTIKQQLGISAGATIHVTENIHVALEYFRAMFQWYRPTPAVAGTGNPKQNLNVVNAGLTYTW
ncbi:MAG: hypothetical protein EOO73_00090 [Myxococcales bacterium]|nr:MAG: hypothetical protein EOO73_00090 [Myxococcales bacterium]